MKKITFLALGLAIGQVAFAQTQPWNAGTNSIYYNLGNVGIGTTTPQTKLDVEGTVSVLSGIHKFHFTELASFDPSKAGMRVNSGSPVLNAKDGGVLYFNRDVNAETKIQSTSGSVTRDIATFKTDGKVGIGTAVPSSLLHIGAGAGEAGSPYSSTTLLQVFQPFNTITPSASIDIGMCQPHARITGWGSASHNGYGQLSFSTMNLGVVTEAMRITDQGKVGIGIADPGEYKLAVNGKVIAREIKVKDGSPWPDYVFNKDYNLMSLASLEVFIKKNNHLPNIPSAQEVKENGGIELGEMNAKLLEKIEELTLHMIEMNKRMQNLEKENESLKKTVSTLSATGKK